MGTTLAIYLSLFIAALAGSLHCIGMCGPILVGFRQAFVGLSVSGRTTASGVVSKRPSAWLDLTAYHAGRIWTYAVLGFVAGVLGQQLWHSTEALRLQRFAALGLSAAVIIAGLALLGVIPGLRLDAGMGACGIDRVTKSSALGSLMRTRGLLPRFLLGTIMGLLPCGLVYAMLATSATLPTPLHSALGMIIFGVGTLPALTGAAVALQCVPARWRAQGARLAAVMVIVTGAWMMTRAAIASQQSHHNSTSPTTQPSVPPPCPFHSSH